jgi:hypothetical protein
VEAGGLADALQRELESVGSTLRVRTLMDDGHDRKIVRHFPSYAVVEYEERFSQVYIAAKERLFLFDFWKRGVVLANASTPDLKNVALAINLWVAQKATTGDLAGAYSFVVPALISVHKGLPVCIA